MQAILTLTGPQAVTRTEDLVAVYAAAFSAPGYDEPPEAATTFGADQLPVHAERDGFRRVLALHDGGPVGFAYGYTGERGQWWSDRVAERAPASVVDEWLGGHFEVVELAVVPSTQGRGLGTTLMAALLRDLPHERALLTTYADDRAAPRLYRRTGWRVLALGLDESSTLYGRYLRQPDSARTTRRSQQPSDAHQ